MIRRISPQAAAKSSTDALPFPGSDDYRLLRKPLGLGPRTQRLTVPGLAAATQCAPPIRWPGRRALTHDVVFLPQSHSPSPQSEFDTPGSGASGTDGSRTLPWREMDSNF
jgi:hypothetical protein